VFDVHKFLKPYRTAGAFNSVIPIRRFLDEQVFLTRNNHLGVVLTAEGIDDECLTDGMLESFTTRMGQAWRSFDERFLIYQYVIKQDGAPIERRGNYPTSEVSATVRHRCEHLETKASGLYTLRLVYVILLEQPEYSGNMLSTRHVLDALAAELERNRAILMDHAHSFRRNIGDLLGIEILGKHEAFGFFRLLVNLEPEIAAADLLKYDAHVDYFLPSVKVACTADGLRIGKANVEVLSLREPPSTFPNVLRDLLKIQCNFILCSQFQRVSNEAANAAVRKAQSGWKGAATAADVWSLVIQGLARFGLFDKTDVIEDKSALAEVDDLDEIAKRINNGGEYAGQFCFTAVLYGWHDRPRIQRAATDVVKTFGANQGSLIVEDWNALSAFLSILPGNQVFSEPRRRWLLSGNYADLTFMYAPYTGQRTNGHLNDEYLVALETNDATVFHFNMHEADELGVLIFGAPGSGKSVTANLFIDHSQKHSPRTFILDIGGSYRQITRKHGGGYLEMKFGDGRQTFRINPFALPNSEENVQFLFTFVRLLLTESGAALRAADDLELFDAVESIYVLDREHRTLGNLAASLPPHLKVFLHAWTAGGQYGSIFDNAEDTLTLSRLQTFDFQGLEHFPQVLQPLLFYILQRISAVVYDPALQTTPKQLFADECWKFLSNETARAYLVAAGKTFRKHNAGIVLVTQSLDDLRGAGVFELISEVCPTRILLASPGANMPDMARIFKLNEKEIELYAGLTPKRQFLLKTDSRAKVLNVDLDPRALVEYGNSPYENSRREAAIGAHGFGAGIELLAADKTARQGA
jgi:type IV secretion/conjugal transfer VirB4 family ATPase